MNTKDRLDYIDFLKGFAIFLMVMGHILSGYNYENPSADVTCLNGWIYTFHMPLFMFMSGYVMDLSNKRKWTIPEGMSFAWRRLQNVLVPGFVLGMGIGYLINGEIGYPWFLRALFEISLTFYILKIILYKVPVPDIVKDLAVLVVGYGLTFVLKRVITDPVMNDGLGMAYWQIFYPYFVIGYIFRTYNLYEKLLKDKGYTVALVTYCLLWYFDGRISVSHGLEAFYRYALALSGVIIAYMFARRISYDGVVQRLFKSLGVISINIYLLHEYFLPHYDCVRESIENAAINGGLAESLCLQLVTSVGVSAYCVLMCYIITLVVSKSDVLNMICFGKIINK